MNRFIIMLNFVYLVFVLIYIYTQNKMKKEINFKLIEIGIIICFVSTFFLVYMSLLENNYKYITSAILLVLVFILLISTLIMHPSYKFHDKKSFAITIIGAFVFQLLFYLSIINSRQNVTEFEFPTPVFVRSYLFLVLTIVVVILLSLLWLLIVKNKVKFPIWGVVLIGVAYFSLLYYLNLVYIVDNDIMMSMMNLPAGITTDDENIFDFTKAGLLINLVWRELNAQVIMPMTVSLMVLGAIPRAFPGSNPAFRWFGNITISFLPSLVWAFVFLRIIPVPVIIVAAFGDVGMEFFAWIFWWLMVLLYFGIVATAIKMFTPEADQ